jgi:hypothetical protein
MAQVPPSASLARLQPPPSLSSTAPWVLSEKMMLFASEWYFKPEGVSKVKRRFESELAKLKLVSYSSNPWPDMMTSLFVLRKSVKM